MIPQLTVQLPNRPGTLQAMVSALAEADVDIKALGVSDRGEGATGEASLIVSDLDKAKAALDAAEHDYAVIDVVAVEMDDRVGGLAAILGLLATQEINVRQLYAFVSRHTSKALAVIRVDDPAKASALLADGGHSVVSQSTIEAGVAKSQAPTPLEEHLGLDFIW
jgi:hypothetical protein